MVVQILEIGCARPLPAEGSRRQRYGNFTNGPSSITNLIRLEVVVAAGNDASQWVAEKAGACREGTLLKRLLLHGVAHDAVMFSLTR